MNLRIQTPRVFLPLLEQDKRYRGVWGGRGSGKSHFFAEAVIERCILEPGLRVVCLREVQKTLKESAKRLLEDKIQRLGVGHMFDVQADCIKTPGNGIIIFQGLQDHTAESIKSLEGFRIAWVEEAQTISERSLELLRPTMRSGSELWFSWNPRNASDPVDKLLRGPVQPERSIVIRANFTDNPFFPLELEEERRFDEKNNRDRYGHIWLGEYEPAAIGAIWDRLTLHQTRREKAPTLERIVVSVDPATTSEPGSDEHGITVGGLGEDQHGYLIDDVSMKGTPRQWAERAIAAYDRYEADYIVAEKNQGGEMVENTIKSVRPDVPVKLVHASRGKHVRAEPIAALYSLGRIHHVGTFDKLEDQMCLFTSAGYEGAGSPDRADSLVWLFSELFPSMTTRQADPVEPVHYGDGGWMG